MYAPNAASTASLRVFNPSVAGMTFAPRIFMRTTLGLSFAMSTSPM